MTEQTERDPWLLAIMHFMAAFHEAVGRMRYPMAALEAQATPWFKIIAEYFSNDKDRLEAFERMAASYGHLVANPGIGNVSSIKVRT